MEVELQRHHFTRHGQHLNRLGKELVASELAKISLQFVTMVGTNPIHMHWMEDNLQEKYSSSRNAIGKPTVQKNILRQKNQIRIKKKMKSAENL
jgi:hypothetical protein